MRIPFPAFVGCALLLVCGAVPSEARTYWVPVVAHNRGALGSVWRSDVALLNLCVVAANVELRLHAGGTTRTAPLLVEPGRQELLQDVVTLFTAGNLSGSLEIASDQELVITSRTYNLNATGTLGQSFEAVTRGDVIDNGESAHLALLQQNASFRTNIGLLNMDNDPAMVTVALRDGAGAEVGSFMLAVPAGEVLQDNTPYKTRFGRSNIAHGFATVTVVAGNNVWAYASVVDNRTGDPTTIAMREFGGDCDFTQALEQFFAPQIHRIDIQVDAAGVQSLLASPREYVHATAIVDSVPYLDVGVRLKGGAGSFVPLDGTYPMISGAGNGNPGKSAFIVDFEGSQADRCMLGLRKLTLNNLVQDDSGIHEVLGYALFRAGGVAASRAVHAVVSFNGVEKGIYLAVEGPDNNELLDRYFGTSRGNLYEGQYGADLNPEGVPRFDQDSGADRSRQDLIDLVALLDSIASGQDATPVLDSAFDLGSYLTFAATEIYLGHWDGYVRSANNYFLHHHPDDETWSFIPWGIDQIFEDSLGPFGGAMMFPGPGWGELGGRVQRMCFTSLTCRSRLAAALDAALDGADATDLAGQAVRARQLVEPRMLAESTAHGDPQRTIVALDRVSAFIAGRRAAIEPWLPCLTGGVVDRDADGHNACTSDCNDYDPGVHPGAGEQCNLADDDCNGVIDDDAQCPRCTEAPGPTGAGFSLCFDKIPWSEADQHCRARGEGLASVHDRATFELLTEALRNRLHAEHAWIGLNDVATEGTFVWSDGSPVDYLIWSSDSPKPQGVAEDCVVNTPWGWSDLPCDHGFFFICKHP